MAWVWTKQYSSSDDGTVLYGINLQNMQTDITNNAADLTSTQTISGTKTFSGIVSFSGTVNDIPKITEYVFWDDDLVAYDGEAVIYQ